MPPQAPDEIIKVTVDKLAQEITDNRETYSADPEQLYSMVDALVVPHFDLTRIARLVLARHWRGASDTQKTRFTEEFKTLMVRTYSTALFEYTGEEEMTVLPLKLADDADRAVVRTEIKLPNTQPVPVNYSFVLGKDGAWRIYDVNIDGISWVINYRTSYDPFVQSNGLDALIEAMAEKNSQKTTTN